MSLLSCLGPVFFILLTLEPHAHVLHVLDFNSEKTCRSATAACHQNDCTFMTKAESESCFRVCQPESSLLPHIYSLVTLTIVRSDAISNSMDSIDGACSCFRFLQPEAILLDNTLSSLLTPTSVRPDAVVNSKDSTDGACTCRRQWRCAGSPVSPRSSTGRS